MAAFALGNDYPPDSPQSRIMQVILDQLIAQPRLELALPLPTDARLLRITGALMADPADNRTLDEWANSGENVSQVALELGYDNISAFIAMFQRCMGMTPRHYLRTITTTTQ